MDLSSYVLMRNSEGKRRTHPEGGVAPDVAPMPPHERLYVCETHAFARHVLGADAAEQLEDFGDIVRGNAPPVVAHVKHGGFGTPLSRHDDLAGAAGCEVGDGISQEIAH